MLMCWAPVCVSGFQQVSNESREYEDLMNIVTSGYLDASSAACFTYSRPRLMNNELLEKEVQGGRSGLKVRLLHTAGTTRPRETFCSSQSCKRSWTLARRSRRQKVNARLELLTLCLSVSFFEFVEKRREMKSDGRTDKELMESFCFLLADAVKVR